MEEIVRQTAIRQLRRARSAKLEITRITGFANTTVYWAVATFDGTARVKQFTKNFQKHWVLTETFLVGLKKMIKAEPNHSTLKLNKKCVVSHRTISRAVTEKPHPAHWMFKSHEVWKMFEVFQPSQEQWEGGEIKKHCWWGLKQIKHSCYCL